ncbi:MAG: restriction endonuclease subunit S [Candidatus Cryptobacteroides sp.]|nr:restriction endonuclease subunit S [Candidatus Cryptobacteroides sp.]
MKCIDDEVPFEIPEGWEWCRFGSIVIHNPQVTADDETNAAFMPMTLIDAGYGSSYTYETKKWATIKTGFTKIATGDIAYAKITPCFQNRKSFILGDVPGGVAAATTELNVIRTYTGTIEEWYILYFLKSEYFIKEARYKGTAGQQRVLSDYIQNKLFPLPPLNEQKRIVQKIQTVLPIIRTYGKSQEALDKLNTEILDKLKLSVLQEAIRGRLVPQDPNDEPASVLLEHIREEKQRLLKEGKLKKKDITDTIIFKGDDNKYYERIGTEIAEIELPFSFPESWAIVKLHSISALIDGEKRSGNYICLDAKYLRGKSYGEQMKAGRFIHSGDNIILVDGENSGEVFTAPIDGYMGSTFKQLWVSETLYLPYVLDCIRFYKEELRNSKKGAAIPHLNKDIFRNLIVGIPPISEQFRIMQKIEFIQALL